MKAKEQTTTELLNEQKTMETQKKPTNEEKISNYQKILDEIHKEQDIINEIEKTRALCYETILPEVKKAEGLEIQNNTLDDKVKGPHVYSVIIRDCTDLTNCVQVKATAIIKELCSKIATIAVCEKKKHQDKVQELLNELKQI